MELCKDWIGIIGTGVNTFENSLNQVLKFKFILK